MGTAVVRERRNKTWPRHGARRPWRWSWRSEPRRVPSLKQQFRSNLPWCVIQPGMSVYYFLTDSPGTGVFFAVLTVITVLQTIHVWRKMRREPIDIANVFD